MPQSVSSKYPNWAHSSRTGPVNISFITIIGVSLDSDTFNSTYPSGDRMFVRKFQAPKSHKTTINFDLGEHTKNS